MKNLFLTSLFIVALSVNANATNFSGNETSTENATATIVDITSVSRINYNVINKVDTNFFTKLIQMNEFKIVQRLVSSGVDLNEKSAGLTPLMHAARQNRTEIVELLLARGANPNIKSLKGYTALDYAKNSKAIESYDIIKNF